MFLRFSKGAYVNGERKKIYRKAVFIGDSVVMEYGDKLVGIAKLHSENDKCLDYDVVVAKQCELGPQSIARFIKDMIGKSNKFSEAPSPKRRKYYVEEADCDALPINANLLFQRTT